MKKILEYTNKHIKTILFVSLSFIIMCFFYVHVQDAFIKDSDTLEMNQAIVLSSNDIIRQELKAMDITLTDISVCFGTYGRENTGEIFIDFYENDILIQEWQLSLSELKEGYHTFSLNSTLQMRKDNSYYIVIKEKYEGENAVAIWTSTNTTSSCYYNETLLENQSIGYYLTYKNDILKTKVLVFMTFAFLLVGGLVIIKIDEKKLMVIILFLMEILYFLISPIGMAPDEASHFWRAFEISCGSFTSEHLGDKGAGGNVLPSALLNIGDKNAEIDWNEKTEIIFSNTALYAPTTYIPQVLGIFIARCFTDNVSLIFYAGRLGNLLLCLVLCIWALYKMPFAKKIIFMIMMFPMTLQEMISMAPDGFVISLSLAFVAYILNICYNKKNVSSKDIFVITSLGILISLCKIVYIVLIFLIVIIPNNKIGEKKKWMTFKIGEISIPILINLIWLSISSRYLIEFTPGVDSGNQVRYILTHIFDYVVIVIRTITENAVTWIEWMFGSSLGALNISISSFMWITFLILFLYEVLNCRELNVKINKYDKWNFLLIFLSGFALICTSLYVQWTAYCAEIIKGIQGRYFTPLLVFLALFIIYSRHEKEQKIGNVKTYVEYGSYCYMLVLLLNGIAVVDVLKYYL